MEWRVGYQGEFRFLDDEHEALAQKLQDLRSSTGDGEKAGPKLETQRFLMLLKRHVDNENDLMQRFSYPERQLHMMYHQSSVENLETILQFFDHKSALEYRERIANHIENRLAEEMFFDRLLVRYLETQHVARSLHSGRGRIHDRRT